MRVADIHSLIVFSLFKIYRRAGLAASPNFPCGSITCLHALYYPYSAAARLPKAIDNFDLLHSSDMTVQLTLDRFFLLIIVTKIQFIILLTLFVFILKIIFLVVV